LVLSSPFQLVGLRRVEERWQNAWSITTREEVPEAAGQNDQITAVVPFGDGRRILALVSQRHRVQHIDGLGRQVSRVVWSYLLEQRDLTTGRVLAVRRLDEKEAPADVRARLALMPDGSAVIGFLARSVYVWPTDPAQPVRRVSTGKMDVWDACLHPSGRWLVTVSDAPLVSVWDTMTWKIVRSFDWGIGPVKCVTISLDGFLAAVGGDNGLVAVWDWDL
jgi:WD40 repeat protein